MDELKCSNTAAWFQQPCIVGVDEAGRGSVMGPMVYGVAACPEAYEVELASKKYDDSKALTAAKREQLFSQMQADLSVAWATDAISAQSISAKMLAPGRTSLNEIAVQSTLGLLRGLQQRGMNIVAVYVDTVGDASKYEARLSRDVPGVKFTVCPKADSIYPIVSAASIAAKVTRDSMQAAVEGDSGTGYPGDAVTKAWLADRLDPVFGFPPDVRFSWQTVTRLLQERGVALTFEADEDEAEQPRLAFSQAAASASTTATERHSFFRTRRIQRAPASVW